MSWQPNKRYTYVGVDVSLRRFSIFWMTHPLSNESGETKFPARIHFELP